MSGRTCHWRSDAAESVVNYLPAPLRRFVLAAFARFLPAGSARPVIATQQHISTQRFGGGSMLGRRAFLLT